MGDKGWIRGEKVGGREGRLDTNNRGWMEECPGQKHKRKKKKKREMRIFLDPQHLSKVTEGGFGESREEQSREGGYSLTPGETEKESDRMDSGRRERTNNPERKVSEGGE